MFASVAHAMGVGGQGGGSTDALMQFMPLILMLGIFYFLLIRPQQKRAKEHKAMLQALKKGDTIITNAGFIGRISDIEDDMLTVDLGETKVQLARGYVAGLTAAKPKTGRKESGKKDAEPKQAEPKEAEKAAEKDAPRDPDNVDGV